MKIASVPLHLPLDRQGADRLQRRERKEPGERKRRKKKGENSVLMARLARHPPLAFPSPQEETLAELHRGIWEPLPVE